MSRRTKEKRLLVCLAMMLMSCGTSRIPSAEDPLAELAEVSDATRLKEHAPVAWAEAERYLAMARQMEEQGDQEQADRFIVLGRIQLEIARSRATHAEIRERRSAAESRKQSLKAEIDGVRIALRLEEAQVERERNRRHLVTVVEENRLQAAAEEERDERFLKKSEKKVLEAARFQVGYEMIGRVEVWKAVIDLFVREELLSDSETKLVDGTLVLAREALVTRDLATVQQLVESCGIEARRLVDKTWKNGTGKPGIVAQELLSRLNSEGFSIGREEFGITWGIASPQTKKKLSWTSDIERLVTILNTSGDVDLIVLASAGDRFDDKVVDEESQRLAASLKDAFVSAGLSERRIISRGVGPASPVTALKDKEITAAVVMIPLPKRKK